MLITARIGVAKRVHILDRYNNKAQWGASICGKWAGAINSVIKINRIDNSITCKDCYNYFDKDSMKTRLLDLKYEE